MRPDETIYAVWGPTAEWGDGAGPLGYFCSRTDAETFIVDEVERTVEAGMVNAWPYNMVGYSIQETSPREMGVPLPMLVLSEEAFLEELNSR